MAANIQYLMPHLDLSILSDEIDKKEEKLSNLIAGCDAASFTDPKIRQALETVCALNRLKDATREIEIRYNDYVKELTKEVKIIAAQIDQL